MSGVKGMNKGNKNRFKGGRLKPDLSLSGKAKDYFKQHSAHDILKKEGVEREPTDDEIKAKCREMTYAWWERIAQEE